MSAYVIWGRDIGGKEGNTMDERIDYTDEPLQIGERVDDFLPAT